MSTHSPGNALTRLFRATANVEPDEAPTVIAAFFLFFFVLGTYFAVRPVRETIGTILGRDYVADLWLYTAIFSIAIVPIYGWLVAKVRRSLLLPWIYGAVAIIFAGVGVVLRADEKNVAVGSFFYVWISVLSLMLVSVFWSFLLEIFSSAQTKRLFGVIAAGGTLGALVGPLTTRLTVAALGNSGIMFIGTLGFLAAIVCQRILLRIWRAHPRTAGAPASAALDRGLGGNPFAGIFIVMKSPYLLGIALFVVLLSAANTFLYFEQLRLVAATFKETTRRTEVFANLDVIVQSLTIFTQFFLTGKIASYLGVRALLTALPAVMVIGFLALAAFNVFAVLAVVFVMRRWGEYAFIRPGREMLFSTLNTETKYKAKNFIDVPIYRAADYVGAQTKTALDAMNASPTASILIAAGLAAAWAVNGWMVGRRHDAAARGEGPVTAVS